MMQGSSDYALEKKSSTSTASLADDADPGSFTPDSSAAPWEIARELRKIRRELEAIRRKK
jgi:hypothetical protein